MSTQPKRMGRPPLPPDAQRSDKRPRSMRLTDEEWALLKSLGVDWLSRQLARAKIRGD